MAAVIVNKKKEAPPKLFRAIGDALVVHLLQAADVTEAGVLIPETASDQWHSPICLVIAAGPDCKWVKEGDRIIVDPRVHPTQVKYLNKDYGIMSEKQVSGIIIEDETK